LFAFHASTQNGFADNAVIADSIRDLTASRRASQSNTPKDRIAKQEVHTRPNQDRSQPIYFADSATVFAGIPRLNSALKNGENADLQSAPFAG
jgi:hypothetical protein